MKAQAVSREIKFSRHVLARNIVAISHLGLEGSKTADKASRTKLACEESRTPSQATEVTAKVASRVIKQEWCYQWRAVVCLGSWRAAVKWRGLIRRKGILNCPEYRAVVCGATNG